MSQPTSTCPNCGAPVSFRFSMAVQTTCEFCRSILIRTDLDLKKVGEVADLPPNVSPIQLGATGTYRNKPFTVVGRILYQWDQGGWNEWHIVFGDNTSGWLSDAQAEYAFSFSMTTPEPLPYPEQIERGQQFTFGNIPFEVTSMTKARYRGVEGELPFEYWDKTEILFADLKSAKGQAFATIDYSDSPPLLFVGESVDFNSLQMKGLRDPDEAAVGVKSGALSCPNCGGAVEIRAQGQSVTVVCIQCLSILDATSPNLSIVQKYHAKVRVAPLIPLGKKGKWKGDEFEVIGFQCRYTEYEGERFEWREYLLFHRTRGFRYFTEYNGHWNDVIPIKGLPQAIKSGSRRAVKYLDETYKHFQGAQAATSYVIGEFPWQVRVGEKVFNDDYISPPKMLSAEITEQEVTWSLGEYVLGAEIWKAFALPGQPPPAIGVYANQPAPAAAGVGSMWLVFLVLCMVMMGCCVASTALMQNKEVFNHQYSFTPGTPGESSFVTSTFELTGRPSNLEVNLTSDADNSWMYVSLALINDDTGQAYDWGREISYYHGSDSDGSWTEGKQIGQLDIGQIPAGKYYLRVEPEWTADPSAPSVVAPKQIHYTIDIKRDVPMTWPYVVAFILLLLPPIFKTFRGNSFETARWKESDYGS